MVKSRKSLWSIILIVSLLLVSTFLLFGCNKENIKEPTLSLKTPFQTEYKLNESLNVTGGQLLYTDEKGEESTVDIEESFVTGFDSSTLGEKTMTITYLGKSINVYYVINPEYANYNEYYQAADDWGTYHYINFTNDGKIQYINNIEHEIDTDLAIPFSVTSKSVQEGQWVVEAEIDNAPSNPGYTAKLKIIIENSSNLSVTLISDTDIEVLTLNFTNMNNVENPEYVAYNTYFMGADQFGTYEYLYFTEDDKIQFINNTEPVINTDYAITFSVISKVVEAEKWVIEANLDNPPSYPGYTAKLRIVVEDKDNISVTMISDTDAEVLTVNCTKVA